MKRTGGAAVIQALESVGVTTAFGIPGTHNLEIYRHLAGSGITHVTPRHEQGAGYAADGYARVTARPAVCLPTSGPGVTNIVTALATAHADSVPMVVVAPGPPRGTVGADLGLLHELRDQRGVLAAVVNRAERVNTPEEAAQAVQRAVRGAIAARPRPAYVEVPVDVLDEPWDGTLQDPEPVARADPPDPALLGQTAELLRAAQRPVLVAGGGCRGASRELAALAEAFSCPVLTTVNGKGVLPEDHRFSLGASLRLRSAVQTLERADFLLLVGTELGDSDLWEQVVTPSGRVVRVDLDPEQLHKNVPSDVAIHGDAGDVLSALATLADTSSSRWTDDELHGLRTEHLAETDGDGNVWRDIQDAVRAAMPGPTIVAGDSAMVSYFGTVHHWPMGPDDRFLYPTGYATLGYGLPAAIGASLARPDTPTVVLVGDGGFMFTVQELMTAVERRLSLPVIVVDNGGYGAIRDQMGERDIEPLGVNLGVPDLAAVGRACGGHGVAVDESEALTAAVASALTASSPTIIHMRA